MKGLLITACVLIVGLVTALILNFVGVVAFTHADGTKIAAEIAASLSTKSGSHVTVTCPTQIAERKGGIDDCQANAGHGTALIRLVEDDSRGHYHYTVQDADVLLPPTPTPAPDALPTTARSQDQYGAVEAAFLTACDIESGGRSGYCDCMLTGLEDRGGPAEVARLDSVIRSGDTPLPSEVMDLYNQCWNLG